MDRKFLVRICAVLFVALIGLIIFALTMQDPPQWIVGAMVGTGVATLIVGFGILEKDLWANYNPKSWKEEDEENEMNRGK